MVYFQSFSNTYAPLPVLEKIYGEALKFPEVVGLSIGTRPDCVDGPVLDLLESYTANHLIWVEYGLQSAHDDTLTLINRGHDAACFAEAIRNTRGRGLKICAHVIIGLPGEERSHVLQTARFLSDLGIDGVKLHLLYVVRGTRLDTLYKEGLYNCLVKGCLSIHYVKRDLQLGRNLAGFDLSIRGTTAIFSLVITPQAQHYADDIISKIFE